jgi:cysteine sulfinate desulfinase/cysteine desulfurase-like protein
MDRTVYLDYAATTPTDQRVVDAMLPFFTERYGNANSLYALGRDAARALEEISQAVDQVHGAAEDVEREAAANREIVEQLGRRTQEVSQAATEHASASEEVTAAAEEQSASTEEMASAAGDLLQGATRLTALMQQFKT